MRWVELVHWQVLGGIERRKKKERNNKFKCQGCPPTLSLRFNGVQADGQRRKPLLRFSHDNDVAAYRSNGMLPVSLLTFFFAPQIAIPK